MTTVETRYVRGEGLTALMAGATTYLVGVEDGSDGSLKAYVGHRARGVYCIVEDPEAQEAFRRAWASKAIVTIPTPPPECLFTDDPVRRCGKDG